jgi:predicted ester cyclase
MPETVDNQLTANKAIIMRYWNDLWNAKNPAVIDEIFVEHPDIHLATGQAHRPENMQVWFEHALMSFPDVEFTVHHLMAEDDHVMARWSYVATHTGTFLGIAPTGKRITDVGMNLFRLENGKIAEFWIIQDSNGLLQQLHGAEAASKAQ